MIVMTFMAVFAGIPLDHLKKTSLKEMNAVFGKVLAFYKIVETQGHGRFHLHAIIFGLLCAMAIQRWTNNL